MKLSRRSTAITTSVVALAFAGAAFAGPASAHDNGGVRAKKAGDSSTATTERPQGRGGKGGKGGFIVYGESIRKQTTTNADGTTTTTYITVVEQSGKVSAVTATTVTITSDNGKVLTWTIPTGNTTVFAVGDEVRAAGTKAADGTITTVHLHKHVARTAPATTSGSTLSSQTTSA